MTADPSLRAAARSCPEGLKRANEAPETSEVCTVVGWAIINGSVRMSEARCNSTSRRTEERRVHGRCKLPPSKRCSELMMQTLDSLVVPPPFARHDRIADTAVLADLYAWKSNTEPLLNQLDSLSVLTLSIPELADLICVLTPLTAVAQWSSPATRSLASGTPFGLSRHVLAKFRYSSPCQNHYFRPTHRPHSDPGR